MALVAGEVLALIEIVENFGRGFLIWSAVDIILNT
jgi:hypothetical protein